MSSELYGGQDPRALDPPPALTPEERRQRIQQSLATLREIFSPEDCKAIAEGARKAHREDFPEDFEEDEGGNSRRAAGRRWRP